MDADALDAYLCLTPRPALGSVRVTGAPERPKTSFEGLPEKGCPDCSKRFHTDSQLAVHRRCSHGLVTERALVTSTECPACHKIFASRDGARTHFQKRLCQESRDPLIIAGILNTPNDPPATQPAPAPWPGSAQAMWGLSTLLLTQASAACTTTLSHFRDFWRRWPAEIGSRISGRGHTRELNRPLRSPAPRRRLLPPWGLQRSGRSLRPPTRLPPSGRSRSPQLLLLWLHMLQSAPSRYSLPALAASERGQTLPPPGFRHVLDRFVATPTAGRSDDDRPPCLVQEGIALNLFEARPIASPAWGLKRHGKEHPLISEHWPLSLVGSPLANFCRKALSPIHGFPHSTHGRRRSRMTRAPRRGRPPEQNRGNAPSDSSGSDRGAQPCQPAHGLLLRVFHHGLTGRRKGFHCFTPLLGGQCACKQGALGTPARASSCDGQLLPYLLLPAQAHRHPRVRFAFACTGVGCQPPCAPLATLSGVVSSVPPLPFLGG